jgi:hypothetical protein
LNASMPSTKSSTSNAFISYAPRSPSHTVVVAVAANLQPSLLEVDDVLVVQLVHRFNFAQQVSNLMGLRGGREGGCGLSERP